MAIEAPRSCVSEGRVWADAHLPNTSSQQRPSSHLTKEFMRGTHKGTEDLLEPDWETYRRGGSWGEENGAGRLQPRVCFSIK